ncbi:hypothetical protein GHV40_16180 [Devosia sp. D6-9]|nr:hypothetical protein GHV40_16180 [Devosia sp. D6-9]
MLVGVWEAHIKNDVISTFDTSPFALLSNRELEMLHLAADGRDLVGVSNILLISPAVVSRHRSNICRKLGTRRRD